jgi:hypothetical protein
MAVFVAGVVAEVVVVGGVAAGAVEEPPELQAADNSARAARERRMTSLYPTRHTVLVIRTYLEVEKSWAFACAIDYPGWQRRGKEIQLVASCWEFFDATVAPRQCGAAEGPARRWSGPRADRRPRLGDGRQRPQLTA